MDRHPDWPVWPAAVAAALVVALVLSGMYIGWRARNADCEVRQCQGR